MDRAYHICRVAIPRSSSSTQQHQHQLQQKLLLDHRHTNHHRYRSPSLLIGTKEYMPLLAAAGEVHSTLTVLGFCFVVQIQYNTLHSVDAIANWQQS
jgi:hypothetical protein